MCKGDRFSKWIMKYMNRVTRSSSFPLERQQMAADKNIRSVWSDLITFHKMIDERNINAIFPSYFPHGFVFVWGLTDVLCITSSRGVQLLIFLPILCSHSAEIHVQCKPDHIWVWISHPDVLQLIKLHCVLQAFTLCIHIYFSYLDQVSRYWLHVNTSCK